MVIIILIYFITIITTIFMTVVTADKILFIFITIVTSKFVFNNKAVRLRQNAMECP